MFVRWAICLFTEFSPPKKNYFDFFALFCCCCFSLFWIFLDVHIILSPQICFIQIFLTQFFFQPGNNRLVHLLPRPTGSIPSCWWSKAWYNAAKYSSFGSWSCHSSLKCRPHEKIIKITSQPTVVDFTESQQAICWKKCGSSREKFALMTTSTVRSESLFMQRNISAFFQIQATHLVSFSACRPFLSSKVATLAVWKGTWYRKQTRKRFSYVREMWLAFTSAD